MSTDKTILIAEPTEILASELLSFLREKGLITIKARTLKETLLTLQGRMVDVLVLDASLLEEDYEFIEIIKGMEEDLPVILCAEINTPEIEGKVRQQKVFYYHIRSFGTPDLQMAISNAINRPGN